MVTRATSRDATLSGEVRASQIAQRAARPFWARIPRYAYLGAALNIAAWTCSWGRIELGIGLWRYTFFAIWLGFILVLDGLNVARAGTSPLTRSRAGFVAMFLISCPFWWTFELLNLPVQNWHYVLDQPYSTLAYVLIASLNFSTVLPAVMEIAELLATVPRLRPLLRPPKLGPRASYPAAAGWLAAGVAAIVLTVAFPHYAYGLVWLCLAFLLDPINNLARRKSALGHLLAGDWRFIVTVPLAGILCGFFWEMWNSRALPRWYYTVPGLDAGPHLFAMPIPGYLGYLPFAVELFAMYQFVLLIGSLIVRRPLHDNLTI